MTISCLIIHESRTRGLSLGAYKRAPCPAGGNIKPPQLHPAQWHFAQTPTASSLPTLSASRNLAPSLPIWNHFILRSTVWSPENYTQMGIRISMPWWSSRRKKTSGTQHSSTMATTIQISSPQGIERQRSRTLRKGIRLVTISTSPEKCPSPSTRTQHGVRQSTQHLQSRYTE